MFVGIIGLMKINESVVGQDDGDSPINNNALIMAAVLLFDGVVDDYVRRQQRR